MAQHGLYPWKEERFVFTATELGNLPVIIAKAEVRENVKVL